METIYLCSIPELDINYENVYDFGSRAEQTNFFRSKVGLVINNANIKEDTEREVINVKKTLRELDQYDYLYFTNDVGKTVYYFITGKEFNTQGTTNLILELDVFSTFLFDHEIMDSFVVRCHVDRWKSNGYPTDEWVDEGLEYGELEIGYNLKLYENTKPGMIIVTSVPIGKVEGRKQVTGAGGGGADCGGSPMDGIISARGYRFIKGYEGFGKEPYQVPGESWRTAGYGITENFKPQWFEKLKPFPCTEQLASEVYGDMVIEDFGKPIRDKLIAGGVNVDIMEQEVFDAFVSLGMNAGLGNLFSSDVFKWYCEKRPISEIAERWLTTFINPGTAVEAGLRARRKAEVEILTNASYEFRAIVTINANGSYGEPVKDNNGNGFIPAKFGSLDCSGSSQGGELNQNIVNSAKKLIGKPYVFGGNYPPLGNDAGTDCSGLIQWAYNDNGKKISRSTYTQIKEGSEVYKVSLRPADLVFTRFENGQPEHVVLFDRWTDKEKGIMHVVEAPRTGLNIRERDMNWEEGFKARRLI